MNGKSILEESFAFTQFARSGKTESSRSEEDFSLCLLPLRNCGNEEIDGNGTDSSVAVIVLALSVITRVVIVGDIELANFDAADRLESPVIVKLNEKVVTLRDG